MDDERKYIFDFDDDDVTGNAQRMTGAAEETAEQETVTEPVSSYASDNADFAASDSHSYEYDYYGVRPKEPEPMNDPDIADNTMLDSKRQKKKRGFGFTLVKAACIAAVFGLIAGGIFRVVGYSGSETVTRTESGETVGTTATSSKPVQIIQADSTSDTSITGLPEMIEEVMPGIVAVNVVASKASTDIFGRTNYYDSEGAGSGVIISESDGKLYILTNYHVVEDSKQVTITFNDDSQADAAVLGYSEADDIAVVTVDTAQLTAETMANIKAVVVGDSDDLKVGENAIAIGNALGYGQSVTLGIVSALGREVTFEDGSTRSFIQTDAAINPGNSGGALLNAKGEVIGINSAKYMSNGFETVEGMGYAIPINTAVDIAKGIISGEIVTKTDENTAYLGIYGGTIDAATAEQYNCPQGVYISSIIRGSAAERAGLQAGYIITYFNGERTETMEDLQAILDGLLPGDTVTIKVSIPDREGNYEEELEFSTILGSRADMQQNNSNYYNNPYYYPNDGRN
ncbi:MAG: trypsin-like peptidase domain-containing protein [Lachnospiraceae bacterium]|nr:trypsin-like peptidase domain-containing protein [Lachnospiraceae bacterium]